MTPTIPGSFDFPAVSDWLAARVPDGGVEVGAWFGRSAAYLVYPGCASACPP